METISEDPEINLLYEDPHILAVHKPEGLLSQTDRTGEPDLLSYCTTFLKRRISSAPRGWLAPVHRLDRPVGGVMILARSPRIASGLSEQIRNREVRKEYLAVCRGETPPNAWLTDHLKKDSAKNLVRVVATGARGAKEAELSYVQEEYSKREDLSLLRIQLITGRPHQIRVQLASAGHPLLGDRKYGERNERGNPALFAFRFTFRHPVSGETVSVQAAPPKHAPWNLFCVSSDL